MDEPARRTEGRRMCTTRNGSGTSSPTGFDRRFRSSISGMPPITDLDRTVLRQFKGTGNMEVTLRLEKMQKDLSIDPTRSGTKHSEMIEVRSSWFPARRCLPRSGGSMQDAWSAMSQNTRRCLVNRFPFGVIFQVKAGMLRIIAVANLHRRPGYWADRV